MGEINRNFTDQNGVAALRMAPANVFMTAGSYMIPKSSLYKGSMNSIVIHQIAMGFAKFAVDKAIKSSLDQGKAWARERPDLFTWSKSDDGPAPLQFNHVKAAFLILIAGMVLGFVSLGAEAWHMWKKKERVQKLGNSRSFY
jgi:hypothetical protein